MTTSFRMARIGRHTVVYGAGILLSKVLSFVMLPFYTQYLTPADYGVLQLVEMTLDVVAIFAGTRIAAGVFKYYQEAQDEVGKRAVLSTSMILLVTSYGVFATATGLAAPTVSRMVFGSPEHATLIRLAAASLGVSSFVTAPFALLRLQERSVRYTAFTSAKLVLQLTLNVVFLAVFGLGVKGVLISTLVSNTALAVWLFPQFFIRVGLKFSRRSAHQLLRYGVPLVGTHIAAFISTFGDRYFLRVSGGVTAVGLYSLAYQFGFILSVLGAGAFAIMWEPMRFEVAKHPDRDAVYSQAFLYLNLLLLTMALGIGLFAGDFIRQMADPAYHRAAALVPVILVAYIVQTWAGFQETGVMVQERTEFITLANWLAAATAILGYALLIPRWLGWGAAISTILAFGVRLIVTHIASQRLLPIRLRWGPVWRMAAVATAVFFVSLVVPAAAIGTSLLVRGALFLVYLLLVWFGAVIPAGDRERLRALVTSLTHSH